MFSEYFIMKKSASRLMLLLFLFTSPAIAQWMVITPQSVDQYRILNGEVEAINKATVSSQTTGTVERFYFDVDDFVEKGATIVEFTNIEQKANLKQAIAQAEASKIAYQQAITDYNRIKEVYQRKLVAKSELDRATSNRDSLKAKTSAANAAVVNAEKQLEYTVIVAPYDGIVTQRFVEQGEIVKPGTPIMEGLSLSKLRVVTNIPESIIASVKSNPEAKILVQNKEIIANNITIFPYADSKTRTFKTRIDFNADEEVVFPGMTVKVAFKIGDYQSLMVPLSSIVTRSELNLLYVKQGQNKILRHVKLGRTRGENVEIISGLNVNEEVLINPLNDIGESKL